MRITDGAAPSAFRSPISRIRSDTETSMMFITPMPPTSREMPAMPPSRMVSVLVVAVAAWTSDCWLAIEKSAVVAVTLCRVSSAAYASWYAAESRRSDARPGDRSWTPNRRRGAAQHLLGRAVSGSPRGRPRRSPPVDPLAASTPITVNWMPLTFTVWPTPEPEPAEQLSTVVAPSTITWRAASSSAAVIEPAGDRVRARTVSQSGVVAVTVVVQVLAPAVSTGRRSCTGATLRDVRRHGRVAQRGRVGHRQGGRRAAPAADAAGGRAAGGDDQQVAAQAVDLGLDLLLSALAQADRQGDRRDADPDAEHGQQRPHPVRADRLQGDPQGLGPPHRRDPDHGIAVHDCRLGR